MKKKCKRAVDLKYFCFGDHHDEMLTVLVPDQEYTGPFADEAEHLFYTNIPNLSQFASTPRKAEKTTQPPKEESVERELNELDAELDIDPSPYGDDESDDGDAVVKSDEEVVETKEERLMKDLLEVNSAESVDKVMSHRPCHVVVYGVLHVEFRTESRSSASHDPPLVHPPHRAASLFGACDPGDPSAVRNAAERGGEERASRRARERCEVESLHVRNEKRQRAVESYFGVRDPLRGGAGSHAMLLSDPLSLLSEEALAGPDLPSRADDRAAGGVAGPADAVHRGDARDHEQGAGAHPLRLQREAGQRGQQHSADERVLHLPARRAARDQARRDPSAAAISAVSAGRAVRKGAESEGSAAHCGVFEGLQRDGRHHVAAARARNPSGARAVRAADRKPDGAGGAVGARRAATGLHADRPAVRASV